MIIPSKVLFYRKDGAIVGDCFVNIGWFINVRSMEDLLFSKLPKQVYTDDRIEYFVVYGWKFPMEFIRDFSQLSSEDRCIILELFLDDKQNHVDYNGNANAYEA